MSEQTVSEKTTSEQTSTPTTISDRKLEANRRNALKSTGPITARGRAISSQNARKFELLPFEDPSTPRQLAAHYYGECIPVNANERRLVETMIRSERIRRYYLGLENRVRIQELEGNEHRSVAAALKAASRRLIMVPFHLDSAECLYNNARKQLEAIRAKATNRQTTESKAA